MMQIEYINSILNKKVVKIGRASTMCWIIFSIQREEADTKWYSLHLQCPWRIRRNNKIVMSHLDIYQLAENSDNEKWDDRKKNVFDEKIENYVGEKDIFVNRIEVTETYDLSLFLSDSSVIEVFVDDLYYESWRFFQKCAPEHLVIWGGEIDE